MSARSVSLCLVICLVWATAALSTENAPDARYLEGKQYLKELKFAEAKEVFAGLGGKSKDPKYGLLLGFCELALGNSAHAKTLLEKARAEGAKDELFPDNPPYTLLVWLSVIQAGDPSKANYLVEQTLRSNPNATWLRLLLRNKEVGPKIVGGVAQSEEELLSLIEELTKRVEDHNRTSDQSSQAGGIFAYCVCSQDRQKILFEATISPSEKDAGLLTSRLKEAAAECGGCYSEPAIEYVK